MFLMCNQVVQEWSSTHKSKYSKYKFQVALDTMQSAIKKDLVENLML